MDAVQAGIAALRTGKPLLLLTDAGGESLGHITLAAQDVDSLQIAFLVRHSSGFLAVPMRETDLDRLDLPLMRHVESDSLAARWAVSVDAAHDIETGISARDRATTARLLADPGSAADDFTRPGHMVPIRTHQSGVVGEPGVAEAAVDLCQLAGKRPVAVVGVFTKDDGSAATLNEVVAFAGTHEIPTVTVDQVLAHRLSSEATVQFSPQVLIEDMTPRSWITSFEDRGRGAVGLLLITGDVDGTVPVVGVERRCLAIATVRECACTQRRRLLAAQIANNGGGIFMEINPALSELAQSYGDPSERHRRADEAEMATAGRVLGAFGLSQVRLTAANTHAWTHGPTIIGSSDPDGAR